MTFPTPETVDIMADVAEVVSLFPARETLAVTGTPPVLEGLSRFAGASGRGVLTVGEEREQMLKLAAHAIARVERLDRQARE